MDTHAYFEALGAGDTDRVRRLLAARPALLGARDGRDATGLHRAVQAGRVDLARLLIEAGVELDARNDEGRTALHDSIELGRGPITELLLERGARVDVCAAAILGRLERLLELLEGDASLAADRSTGLSPLGWAAYGNQVETARALLQRGQRPDDGELLCAASCAHVEVGRLLLEHGADPNELHREAGGNALHVAVSMPHTPDGRPFVRLLLEHGVDLDRRAANGRTALELAQAKAAQHGDTKPFAAVARLLAPS